MKMADEAEQAEKYQKAKEKVEQGTQAYGLGKTAKDLEKDEHNPVFEKSKADLYADVGVELVSQIPGVGGLTKCFAWMFIEIGLSNYAGVVAGIRARVFSCFTAGFITGITLVPDTMTLKNERDKKYYEWGLQRAIHYTKPVSFRHQIALLDYARTHFTDNFWGRLNLPIPWPPGL